MDFKQLAKKRLSFIEISNNNKFSSGLMHLKFYSGIRIVIFSFPRFSNKKKTFVLAVKRIET